MTAPTTAELLKYADLQMAAEAFLVNENGTPKTGTELNKALTDGNFHSSKFTALQATEFGTHWEVLDQRANTTTGFSGTLFKNKDTNELVMSFRSTEFIDDAARDNQATNSFEIKDTGFAWGQLSDMETWYAELRSSGKLPDNQAFSVTGYSLGGHLATVFNLLHPGAAQQVITFNGAGIGKVKFGTDSLSGLLQEFKDLRADPAQIDARFTDPQLKTIYQNLRDTLSRDAWNLATVTGKYELLDQAEVLLNSYTLPNNPDEPMLPTLVQEKGFISSVLREIRTLVVEAERVGTLVAGGSGADATNRPVRVLDENIEAQNLDYRMAVKLLAQKSQTAWLLNGVTQAYGSKAYLGSYGTSPIGNQFDVMGDTSPSAVSNSQWHIGKDVRIFIEDQPLYRGGIGGAAVEASLDYGNIALLVNGYATKDFGDTHSLVLLVDSLNVQNTLLQLVAPDQREISASALKGIFQNASNLRKEDGDLSTGSGQGKAEGNVLENVLNALGAMLKIPGYVPIKGGPEGGTWADVNGSGEYAGRTQFYEALDKIQKDSGFVAAAGTARLVAAPASWSSAREDFGALLSLVYLAPFALKFNGEVPGELQNAQQELYGHWVEDKSMSPELRALGKAHISDAYLKSRAEFLTRVTYYNSKNARYDTSICGVVEGDSDATLYDLTSPDIVWTDRAANIKIQRGGATDSTQYVVFGSDQNEIDIQGGQRDDRLYGMAGNDTLNGLGGNDYLEGGSGDDTLDGGEGNDILVGGTGNDTYVFTSAWGKDTLLDGDDSGSIQIDGATLGKAKAGGKRNLWVAELDTGGKVEISVYDSTSSTTGKELVIRSAGNTITINNFNLAAAQTETGYLGIKLDNTAKVIIRQGTGVNPFTDASFDPAAVNGTSAINEGGGGLYTIFLSTEAKAGDTFTLALSGLADKFKAVLGDSKVDAHGAVITLAEGQTQVSFSLVQEGELAENASTQLGVTYRSGQESESITSNTWGINLADAGQAGKTYNGDQRALLRGLEIDPQITADDSAFNTYKWSATSWAIDGTLIGGVAQANFHDVITGSTGNDRIFGLGGNDALDGGDGNDEIDGGIGDDLIGGGAGSDNIKGGAGNDTILSATGLSALQRNKPDEQYTLPPYTTLRAAGPTWATYYQDANTHFIGGGGSLVMDDAPDVIDAGDGDDLVIAGLGNDRIRGGAGADRLWGHGGDDIIEGEEGDDMLYGDGVGTIDAYQSVDPALHGSDFMDGGAGNDQMVGGGGNDAMFGGSGNDVMRGDTSGVRATAIGWLPGIHHGDDYLDGEDGDDELAGEGGADTLYGGAGDDVLEGDRMQDSLHAEFHGDDYLDGEEGNDILIGGGGDDILLGGDGHDALFGDDVTVELSGYVIDSAVHGRDYLDGGSGDDELTGGGGDDELFGGDGNDWLRGDGAGLALAFHGDDYLDGGEGDDTLYGDGGNDTLIGGAGDDYLDGGEGDDVLDGGSGNNLLLGGAGNDRYILRTADATTRTDVETGVTTMDTGIDDGEGQNVLQIGAALADLTVEAGGQGLGLRWGEAGVYLQNVSAAGSFIVELADGTQTTVRRLAATTLNAVVESYSGQDGAAVYGGKLADTLVAYGSGSIVSGGLGDDTIRLDGVNQTLEYFQGDGVDTVSGYGQQAVIALEGAFNLDDLKLEVNFVQMSNEYGEQWTEQKTSVRLRAGIDERMNLGIGNWLNNSNFIDHFALANSQTLSFKDLVTRGVLVTGTDQNDQIFGTDASDQIYALAGDDTVDAGAGDDTIYAGTGTKQLRGGEGRDTYVIGGANAGSNSQIDDNEGVSLIRLTDVSDWQSVALLQPVEGSNDLTLSLNDGAFFTITDALLRAGKFSIQLASGETRSLDSLIAGLDALGVAGSYNADMIVGSDQGDVLDGDAGDDQLSGGAGDDLLFGGDGRDVLAGGLGDDILFGGDGDDSYVIEANGGNDQIFDYTGVNSVRFLANITPGQLAVERLDESTDLLIRIDANNSVLVRRALEGSVASYSFADGTQWSYADLINRVASADGQAIAGDDLDNVVDGSSGADLLLGNRGNDVLRGHDGNDELIGGDGDDELAGGAGDDVLNGGAGADTFHFALGDGVDRLIDTEGNSTLRFGQGITLADLSASRVVVDGDNYVRLAYGAADAVLIKEGVILSGAAFKFSDGTTLSQAEVYSEALAHSLTENPHTSEDDEIYGYAGNDFLLGGGGNDRLFGGKGDDGLDGGEGDDELMGGAGDDVLDGDEGSDILNGGEGRDTYVMGLNGGRDTVMEVAGEDSVIRLVQGDNNSLSYARVGRNLLLTNSALNTSFYIPDFYVGTGSWILKTASGLEMDLRALAVAGLLDHTPEQRRENFYAGLVSPFSLEGRIFSDTGTQQMTDSSGNEYVYSFNRVRKLTQSDEAEITAFEDSSEISRESSYLRSVQHDYSYQVSQTTFTTSSVTTGGRTIAVPIASGVSFGAPAGWSIHVGSNGQLIFVEPFTTRVTQIPHTTTTTITGTYEQRLYRYVMTGSSTIEDVRGGDQANTITLEGTASKLVTAGGGNDAVLKADHVRNDYFGSTSSSNWVDGGAGDDIIQLGRGDDELSGGQGSDYLDGGAGADTYVVAVEDDGWDTIYDSARALIQVSFQSSWYGKLDAQLVQDLTSIMINPLRVRGGHDSLTGEVEATTENVNELMRIDLARPSADERSDSWQAQGWNLPMGRSTLNAPGAYHLPDYLQSVADTVRFGNGIAVADLQLSWSSVELEEGTKDVLLLSWGGPGGIKVVMPDVGADAGQGIEVFEFADGSTMSMQQMLELAPPRVVVTNAIVNGTAIPEIRAVQDQALSFAIPSDAFILTGNKTARYAAKLAGSGEDLPSWLQFDMLTGTFSGTPLDEDVGELTVEVKAYQTSTLLAQQTFTLTIADSNDAPEVVNEVGDLEATAGQHFSWVLPSGVFEDRDVGDRLSYRVEGEGGAALPAWLKFNYVTGKLEGTPGNMNAGLLTLQLVATDLAGARAVQVFSLDVHPGINQAPVVSLLPNNQHAVQTKAFAYTLPAGTFTDSDAGDVLTLSAHLSGGTELPGWLAFNAATQTFSGIPPDTEGGPLTIEIAAVDAAGATVSAVFNLDIADIIAGTDADDILAGTTGNDVIDGGAGADRMSGGKGDDVYYVDDVLDKAIEKANEGHDTVRASVSFKLGANVEDLMLEGSEAIDGTGNGLGNMIRGNDQANKLKGGAGDDLLFGMGGDDHLTGGLGADIMLGGEGDDLYEVDNENDRVTEWADEGTDTVEASVTYTLSANVENLILTGTATIDGTGNDLNNLLQGNAADNTLTGGAGNDTLNGKQGLDTLIGGAGNDTYLFEDDLDIIVEDEGGGRDTLISRLSVTLAANVEDGILLGSATSLTGNELSNVLTGNNAANILDGGAGADVMMGGKGNDLYIVDSQADTVMENAAEGTDTVQSSISYSLGDNVEHLTLTGTAEAGMGNELNNKLTGNAASNKLWGGAGNDELDGGAGADILFGGLGNDKYWVDSPDDLVVENAGEGTDTVYASVSYVLADNVERLTLTGSANINAVGNALNNRLEGNAGNNVLFGGLGNDTYVWGRGSGQDIIVNFDAGKPSGDTVQLGADIAEADLGVARQGNDLVLSINGTTDQLTVANYFENAGKGANALEKIRFADGTSWNHAAVLSRTTLQEGASSAQMLPPEVLAGNPTALFDAPEPVQTQTSDAATAPQSVAESIAAAKERFEQGLQNLTYSVDEQGGLSRSEFAERRVLPLLWNLQDALLDMQLAKNPDGRFTADISMDSRATRDLGLGIALLGGVNGTAGQLGQVARPQEIQQFDLAQMQ